LLGQLVERLSGMSAGDSALLAAFAAGIAGQARQQIEENISHLMIDLWDKYAVDYAHVKPGDQGAYLDRTFLELIKTAEVVSGQTSNKSDTELLADARQQAQRDLEAMRSGQFKPPGRAMANFFGYMRNNVGDHAAPVQRSRGELMMRDMVRHFRGEDGG